jgi:hypothetical protein
MVPVVNLGAFSQHPVYRAQKLFRGLGQEDWWASENPDYTTEVTPNIDVPTVDETIPTIDTGAGPEVTASNPDWGSAVDTGVAGPEVTASNPDWGSAVDTGVTSSGTATLPPVTSESTPSQLSPSSGIPTSRPVAPSSSGAAPGGSDILSSVGKFFTSLLTPSNIAAGVNAAKAASAPKPKAAPILTLPIGSQGIAIDSGTLLVAGGVTVGVIVLAIALK